MIFVFPSGDTLKLMDRTWFARLGADRRFCPAACEVPRPSQSSDALRSGDCGRQSRTRWSSLVFSSCVKASRCLVSWSCCRMSPPQRSHQRVEHVCEGWSGASLPSGWSLKHRPPPCFLTYTLLLLTLIHYWDSVKHVCPRLLLKGGSGTPACLLRATGQPG